MHCLTMRIVVASLSLAATAALAADYEIREPAYTSTPDEQHWTVERLDFKNKRLYRCDAFSDQKTSKLTGHCTETHGFSDKRSIEGPNLQTAMSNLFGGLPIGYWQSDRTSGKIEFCTLGPVSCLEVTPK